MKRSKLHYRPEEGFFGDPIPFFWSGQYHLFYLQGQIDPWRRVRYTPYCHLVSTDLINWEEMPIALPCGAPEDIDMSLGTGTVIERHGTFYLLYCGRVFKGDRKADVHWEKTSTETVCLATSPDLVNWTKDRGNPILVPDHSPYEVSDFRDPFPFWNEEEQCYWMLIASVVRDEGKPNNGALALAVSHDLRHWELREPFYVPNMTPMAMECPDIFHTDEKWYLFYSCDWRTVYRFTDRLTGTWHRPFTDPREHCNFYAGKTLYDGKRRFLFGWMATKAGEKDDGAIEWGGDMMIPRQLITLPDGSLAETCPVEVLSACGDPVPFSLDSHLGEWEHSGSEIHGRRDDGLAYAIVQRSPEHVLLETSLVFDQVNGSAGIFFRARSNLETYYALRLDPSCHRVAVERWPRLDEQAFPEQAFLVERPLEIVPGTPVRIQLFIDGDIIEAFVNDRFALCCRAYDYPSGELGIFTEFSRVTFRELSLRALPL